VESVYIKLKSTDYFLSALLHEASKPLRVFCSESMVQSAYQTSHDYS